MKANPDAHSAELQHIYTTHNEFKNRIFSVGADGEPIDKAELFQILEDLGKELFPGMHIVHKRSMVPGAKNQLEKVNVVVPAGEAAKAAANVAAKAAEAKHQILKVVVTVPEVPAEALAEAPAEAPAAAESGYMAQKEKKKGGLIQVGLGTECANCAAPKDAQGIALKSCSRCKLVWYCTSACQKQHWKEGSHKRFCVAVEDRKPPASK